MFCRRENTETQKATEYFWNPIPDSAELNFWIFESLNPICRLVSASLGHPRSTTDINLWILESLNRPKSLSRTLFRESSAKLIFESFATKAPKHRKPQDIFWILESLNFWIFESLNSLSHECTNVLSPRKHWNTKSHRIFLESYTRFSGIEFLNFWIFESLNPICRLVSAPLDHRY